jgi:hypothetical protein
MGDIADMILDGILCETCGGLIGDVPEAVGYPRQCDSCKPKSKKEVKK